MKFKNTKIEQKPLLGRKPKAQAGDAFKGNQVLGKKNSQELDNQIHFKSFSKFF